LTVAVPALVATPVSLIEIRIILYAISIITLRFAGAIVHSRAVIVDTVVVVSTVNAQSLSEDAVTGLQSKVQFSTDPLYGAQINWNNLDTGKERYARATEDGLKLRGKRIIDNSGSETSGIVTLVSGGLVVNTSEITATSIVILTVIELGVVTVPTQVFAPQSLFVVGTSFEIVSANILDESVVFWEIVEIV